MLFRWLKRRRRHRILSQPFPADWRTWLEQDVVIYPYLDAAQQALLRDLVQVFVAEKNWEGLKGVVVTDVMRVTIAAQASLLLLGRPEELHFDHVLSILIYPNFFLARDLAPNKAGVVSEHREARIGEAWYRGPVIVSWQDALADARGEGPGGNVVLHEFAHQLDMLNGREVDGMPPLGPAGDYDRWAEVMSREFKTLRRECRHGIPGVLDCYGVKSPAEFFAVATESFFEEPLDLQAESPNLFDVLRDFYRLDPTRWFPKADGTP
jgi:hypothetical protein